MKRVIKQDYMTSIRMPRAWSAFINEFAAQWSVPPAYVYRSAIRDFVRKHSNQPMASE